MKGQNHVLHFTLGPVQSFIEQARRTRDLWAGSFLLSYLSGQAMKAVIDAGGRVVFPAVLDETGAPEDELLRAIMDKSHNNPQIGSLPNRFKAEVPEDFDAKVCEQAVRSSWTNIANIVWERCVSPVAGHGNGTRGIWDRQVERFWDIAWVMGESNDPEFDGAWLGRRRNWRTHQPSEEGGDHCTLMGEWQELSGFIRARARDAQEAFWDALRSKLGKSELGEHERLCTIALIKRLYPRNPRNPRNPKNPRIAEETIGWSLEVKNWPSTPYMAAVPWLKEAHTTQEAKDYLQAVEEVDIDWAFGEYNTKLKGLEQAGRFAKLDGNFFHKAALENKNATPGLNDEQRCDLLSKLNDLDKAVGHPAGTFYALLLMDGDSLGKLLHEAGEDIVSRALGEFTEGVDRIISEHSGKTVYAGGDDVMALLPLDGALGAASQLREHYRKAFGGSEGATISGAIVFAHYNLSLRAVLEEAHHQLDDIAKEQNGRDSLAVAVLTGSGRTVQWVSTWQEETSRKPLSEILKDLSKAFVDKQFSSKFFYNVRERFDLLTDKDKRLIEGLDGTNALRLLTAEYQKSREQKVDEQKAEETVDTLLRVCRRRKNGETEDTRSLLVDGALLVRFLATKGQGVER